MALTHERANASTGRPEFSAMKVRLRDLPESVRTSESTSIVRVVHDMNTCVVLLTSHPSGQQIEISFAGVVGIKILDERDFSAFWRASIEPHEEIEGALVSQVMSGGWSQQQEISGSHVPTGFYGEVLEYFVSGHYECVNVLCTEPPTFGGQHA